MIKGVGWIGDGIREICVENERQEEETIRMLRNEREIEVKSEEYKPPRRRARGCFFFFFSG